MPQPPRAAPAEVAPSTTSYGQVIEYIQSQSSTSQSIYMGDRIEPDMNANLRIVPYADRLYLASYTHPPNAHTPFPYPSKQSSRSPSKRSSRAQNGPTEIDSAGPTLPPVYFSIDRSLLYNAFHADFGPLHIGHLYRFAVLLHEVLGDPENETRAVVFWSNADSRSES